MTTPDPHDLSVYRKWRALQLASLRDVVRHCELHRDVQASMARTRAHFAAVISA